MIRIPHVLAALTASLLVSSAWAQARPVDDSVYLAWGQKAGIQADTAQFQQIMDAMEALLNAHSQGHSMAMDHLARHDGLAAAAPTPGFGPVSAPPG